MIRTTFTFHGAGEDFGPRADGLVTAHTWENSDNGITVARALSGLVWQDGDDVAGSYNDVICIDGIVSSVPPNHASGGINPGSAAFAPEQWLYGVMEPEMVRNPNYFTRNVVFMGTKAYFDANGWPPEMIDHFVTVMLEEEARIGRRVVLTDHEDFQTNRSDAGPIANALIRKRYAERTAKEDTTDMQFWRPVEELWDVFAGTRFWDAAGTLKTFTSPDRVKSIAETADGKYRMVRYGPDELLVLDRWGGTRPKAVPGSRVPPAPQYANPADVEVVVDQGAIDKAVAEAVATLNARIDAAQRG